MSALSCTWGSRSRWISGEARTPGSASIEAPAASALRTADAVASEAARLALTLDNSLDSSDSCCVARAALLFPSIRSERERKSATLPSASFTFALRSAISGSSQSVASALDCCLAPR